MFYIQPRLQRNNELAWMRAFPIIVVFIALLSVTLINWKSASEGVRNEQRDIITKQNKKLSDRVSQAMTTYADTLRSGAGLFKVNENVTEDEWHKYFESIAVTERYPGIQSVGYTVVLDPQEKPQFEGDMKIKNPNFSIFPNTDQPIFTSVVYVEPMRSTSKAVIGYDMYSDPTRRAAMDKARQSKDLALSDAVTLVNESSSLEPQPAVLLYLPIYKSKASQETLQTEYSNTQGYVFAAFRTYDFINKAVNLRADNYEFMIQNVTKTDLQTIYKSPNYNVSETKPNVAIEQIDINMFGAKWRLKGIVSQEAVGQATRQKPGTTLGLGLMLSLLATGFLYLLLGNRAAAVALSEDQAIQQAKDELLALASHQLRTPATGVKQYVGMLRDGFAGKVTPTQKKLLDKAYESNERQLATINEMLFVARADAGNLVMDSKPIQLNSMLKSITDEQMSAIISSGLKTELHIPKKVIVVAGDGRYLRMAIENIISNSTKYTKPGGKITLTLKQNSTHAQIVVQDTGVGVADHDMILLFKKFSRVPNELTDQVVGSGIGLFLAKKIIELHDGDISFKSVESKGSVVTIIIPFENSRNKGTNQQLTSH